MGICLSVYSGERSNCHPCGKKILARVPAVRGLARGALKFAREVPVEQVEELHTHLGRMLAVEAALQPVDPGRGLSSRERASRASDYDDRQAPPIQSSCEPRARETRRSSCGC